jgi:hypothetical protein
MTYNVSGKANWTIQDTPKTKKTKVEDKVEEKTNVDYKPFDKDSFDRLLSNAKIEYDLTHSKNLGDILTHLERIDNLLKI